MSRTIAPVLLAAGSSSRFGGGHKLLAQLDLGHGARPVIAHAAASLSEALGPPLVVIGARANDVAAALGCDARIVHNPDHAHGMGTSLALAARTLLDWDDPPAMLLALGDMPLVDTATHRAVAIALGDAPDAAARAVATGRPGHPIALGPAWLALMVTLTGDEGLRAALRAASVTEVAADPRTQLDVDTREALARAAGWGRAGSPGHADG